MILQRLGSTKELTWITQWQIFCFHAPNYSTNFRNKYKDYYNIKDLTSLDEYDLNKKILTDGSNFWITNNK